MNPMTLQILQKYRCKKTSVVHRYTIYLDIPAGYMEGILFILSSFFQNQYTLIKCIFKGI
jgi:hypothetical protein